MDVTRPLARKAAGLDPAVFAALASPVRRDLLDLLRIEPRSVGELAVHFEMARPSVSEHLKVLRDARLVTPDRLGRRQIYRLTADPLRDVAVWLSPYEQFWRQKLSNLRTLLDDEET